jgi:anaerobic magnesium-protoporphyrin IX monomethyl ester cyclase
MKILFVYPEIRTDIPDFSGFYAEGVAVLSSVVKSAGHETELLHITRPMSPKKFAAELSARDYDVLGFSSLSPMFGHVKTLAPVAREVRDRPTLYGGVHPTLDPEGALAVDGIDMVCVGEGEGALPEVLDCLEQGRPIRDIRNIWVKGEHGKAQRTPIRDLVKDLDSLPVPDFSLFDIPNLLSAREGVAALTASRGCPFRCSYCSNHKMRARYPNPDAYVRFKSVRRTVDEARHLLSLCDKLKYFDFSDDIFILHRDWLAEFAETFSREVGRAFVCNALVRLVDEERVGLLKRAGCTMVTIGLESGSERMRREVLKRPQMTNRMILDAGRLLRKHNIRLATYNMIGLPTETLDEAFETIGLNAELKPTKINEIIFQPYPNTDLFQRCVEWGLYDGTTLLPDNWRKTSVLRQTQFSTNQVVFLNRYFKILVRILQMAEDRSPGSAGEVNAFLRKSVLGRRWLTRLLNLAHGAGFTSLKFIYVKMLRGVFNRRAREFSAATVPAK